MRVSILFKDYHVIAILKGATIAQTIVFDFDVKLNAFPCDFLTYSKYCLCSVAKLAPQFQRSAFHSSRNVLHSVLLIHRMYRVIPALEYLQTFASDRSRTKKPPKKVNVVCIFWFLFLFYLFLQTCWRKTANGNLLHQLTRRSVLTVAKWTCSSSGRWKTNRNFVAQCTTRHSSKDLFFRLRSSFAVDSQLLLQKCRLLLSVKKKVKMHWTRNEKSGYNQFLEFPVDSW